MPLAPPVTRACLLSRRKGESGSCEVLMRVFLEFDPCCDELRIAADPSGSHHMRRGGAMTPTWCAKHGSGGGTKGHCRIREGFLRRNRVHGRVRGGCVWG